jgi:hypothetical protein
VKLWLLRPVEGLTDDNPWNPWYDKSFGFVVRAESEGEARAIAALESSGGPDLDNPAVWLDPHYADCIELTAEGKAGVILGDYRSA